MRLRVGAVACLLFALFATGCRNGLNPDAISDQAPETWITAAPQDTATIKNAGGVVVTPGIPGLIPVRFHVYWAGADKDGAVDHYMVAVTETTAVDLDGFGLPPLPGPTATPPAGTPYRAGAYYPTTRTDSIITFSASIDASDRYHCFYVYAVDNKGKADPTPARFAFRAYDRYPPLGVMDEATGCGFVYVPTAGGIQQSTLCRAINDSFVVTRTFPSDTVPSGSTLTFRWHGEPRFAGATVAGYQYRLEESSFNIVGPEVTVATYGDVNKLTAGTKQFTLLTVGQSGWRSKLTRFFQMNFAPDDWFSGPDLNDPQWQTYQDLNGHRYWYQDVEWSADPALGGVNRVGGLQGTLLSPDSTSMLPAVRPERRTFFEIYANRIWAHQEGDTVNLNSWVVVPSGGTDLDSPYSPQVDSLRVHPSGTVFTAGPPNGSPIGFRYRIATLKANGQLLAPSESATYPDYRGNSSFFLNNISCYVPMSATGKCYLYTAAQDGDGTVDRRISRAGGAAFIAEHVDAGGGDLLEREARSKILVFYVNHRPWLKTGGTFSPTANDSYQRGTLVTFNLFAADLDPIDFPKGIDRVGGPQPGTGPVLVRYAEIVGTNAEGRDTTFSVAPNGSEVDNNSFILPTYFMPGPAHVRISVCDYRLLDIVGGNTGRCSDVLDVPITITGPQPAVPSTGASQSTSRPGSTSTDGRRQQP
jgi:hypothetical protein